MKIDPFAPFLVSASRSQRLAMRLCTPLLRQALALPTYEALFERVRHSLADTFAKRALEVLDVTADVVRSAAALPPTGPLVVVANHPHGILDGLVMAAEIQRTRTDVRVLTSHLLRGIPELEDMCLFVDVMSGRATSLNQRSLRAAARWLTDGHALIVFPAGEVAHTRVAGEVSDSRWRDTAARLAIRTDATVVPAFIDGGNSRVFYTAGRAHSLLRSMLLPRELLRQRGTQVRVFIGEPLAASALTSDTATHELNRTVERLRRSADVGKMLAAEIHALPVEHRLVSNGRFDVYCAPASLIPNTLREIGRLREIAFRAVGEGTGRDLDLDRFDRHYHHLFAWNRDRRELAGAYRVGDADAICASHGIDGLYTSTLFRFDQRLLARIGPALELGRSFVRLEYQRSPDALLLLWKGIARFVSSTRRHRALFGPVSISSRYSDTSQQLLRAFLWQHARHAQLAGLVTPTNPPVDCGQREGVAPRTIDDVPDLDRAIAALEGDGKGVPVLLRQYLRLNARLLAFNVDPSFGNALDALMVVDLADVDPALLARYFGSQAASELLARLRSQAAERAA